MADNLIHPQSLWQPKENEVQHIGALPPDLGERRPGRYQALVMDGLAVVAALLFGFGYRLYLAGSFSPWLLIGILFVFGVISGLQAILIEDKGRRLWVIVCEVLAISFFFYNFDLIFLGVAALLLYIFFAWGYVETRREFAYGTTIRLFRNTHAVIGKFITGTLLFMVLLYVPEITPGANLIPQNTFNGFFSWAANIVENWYPSIPLTGSFGDLMESIATGELKGNPQFNALSPQNQSTTVAENATMFVQNFSKSINISIQASDTVPAVFYAFLQKTLSGWRSRFATVFLLGWSTLIFIILRSVGIIFIWICQVLLGIVYEILIAGGLITIKQQTATQEVIQYR